MTDKRFGIIGGGIAGLTLARLLGEDSEVLEKENECGGLCRSFRKEGFTYDQGGHVLFSKDSEVLSLALTLLNGNADRHLRRNSIWFKNRMVKYPFENGLSVLDAKDRFECLYHFIKNEQRAQTSFEDWIFNTFGTGLADLYLIPYNKKIWKHDLRSMSADWVERIPRPPLEKLIQSAVGMETEGHLEQLNFYYPASGGFQALPRAMEKGIEDRIIRKFAIESVTVSDGSIIVANANKQRSYEKVISTIPVPLLVSMLESCPDDIRDAAASLKYNSLILVLIVSSESRSEGNFGIYFPQPDLIFHRVCFYDFFGESYAPGATSPMVAEITTTPGDAIWNLPDDKIINTVIEGLEKESFLDRRKMILTDVQRIPFAYVIDDLQRRRNMLRIREYLEGLGIELCGRFAEFQYYNSDMVMRSAINLSQKLKKKEPAGL